MKKIALFLAFGGMLHGVHAQQNWSVGINSGLIGNKSVYSGGNTEASALFNHNPHGGIVWGGLARYFYTSHWSFQTGLNHSRLGFEFALAKNYSLMQPKDHFVKVESSYSVTQVPLTAIYAFNPDCRGNRFFVGAGINLITHLHATSKDVAAESTEKAPIPPGEAISQHMEVGSFFTATGQIMWGVEHLMKRGGILQLAFVANKGFSEMATATVNYTVAGTSYQHSFTNRGDYCGVMLNYYFKPFPKRAIK